MEKRLSIYEFWHLKTFASLELHCCSFCGLELLPRPRAIAVLGPKPSPAPPIIWGVPGGPPAAGTRFEGDRPRPRWPEPWGEPDFRSEFAVLTPAMRRSRGSGVLGGPFFCHPVFLTNAWWQKNGRRGSLLELHC